MQEAQAEPVAAVEDVEEAEAAGVAAAAAMVVASVEAMVAGVASETVAVVEGGKEAMVAKAAEETTRPPARQHSSARRTALQRERRCTAMRRNRSQQSDREPLHFDCKAATSTPVPALVHTQPRLRRLLAAQRWCKDVRRSACRRILPRTR